MLALLPFVPRGGGTTTARSAGPPGPEPHAPLTAGYGRLTPAYQREISRVVAAGDDPSGLRPDAGPHPGRRPRPLRGLRGPALLPRLGLDRPHPGPGAAQHGGRRRPPGRPPDREADQHRRPLDDRRAAPGRPPDAPAARRRRRPPSSPRPPARSPRSGCCATRSRACRSPPHFFARHPEVRAATGTSPPPAPVRRPSLAPAVADGATAGQALARLPDRGDGPRPAGRDASSTAPTGAGRPRCR